MSQSVSPDFATSSTANGSNQSKMESSQHIKFTSFSHHSSSEHAAEKVPMPASSRPPSPVHPLQLLKESLAKSDVLRTRTPQPKPASQPPPAFSRPARKSAAIIVKRPEHLGFASLSQVSSLELSRKEEYSSSTAIHPPVNAPRSNTHRTPGLTASESAHIDEIVSLVFAPATLVEIEATAANPKPDIQDEDALYQEDPGHVAFLRAEVEGPILDWLHQLPSSRAGSSAGSISDLEAQNESGYWERNEEEITRLREDVKPRVSEWLDAQPDLRIEETVGNTSGGSPCSHTIDRVKAKRDLERQAEPSPHFAVNAVLRLSPFQARLSSVFDNGEGTSVLSTLARAHFTEERPRAKAMEFVNKYSQLSYTSGVPSIDPTPPVRDSAIISLFQRSRKRPGPNHVLVPAEQTQESQTQETRVVIAPHRSRNGLMLRRVLVPVKAAKVEDKEPGATKGVHFPHRSRNGPVMKRVSVPAEETPKLKDEEPKTTKVVTFSHRSRNGPVMKRVSVPAEETLKLEYEEPRIMKVITFPHRSRNGPILRRVAAPRIESGEDKIGG